MFKWLKNKRDSSKENLSEVVDPTKSLKSILKLNKSHLGKKGSSDDLRANKKRSSSEADIEKLDSVCANVQYLDDAIVKANQRWHIGIVHPSINARERKLRFHPDTWRTRGEIEDEQLTAPSGVVCDVIVDYEAQKPEEMSLVAGRKLLVLWALDSLKQGSIWLHGVGNGQRGEFPGSCVKLSQDKSVDKNALWFRQGYEDDIRASTPAISKIHDIETVPQEQGDDYCLLGDGGEQDEGDQDNNETNDPKSLENDPSLLEANNKLVMSKSPSDFKLSLKLKSPTQQKSKGKTPSPKTKEEQPTCNHKEAKDEDATEEKGNTNFIAEIIRELNRIELEEFDELELEEAEWGSVGADTPLSVEVVTETSSSTPITQPEPFILEAADDKENNGEDSDVNMDEFMIEATWHSSEEETVEATSSVVADTVVRKSSLLRETNDYIQLTEEDSNGDEYEQNSKQQASERAAQPTQQSSEQTDIFQAIPGVNRQGSLTGPWGAIISTPPLSRKAKTAKTGGSARSKPAPVEGKSVPPLSRGWVKRSLRRSGKSKISNRSKQRQQKLAIDAEFSAASHFVSPSSGMEDRFWRRCVELRNSSRSVDKESLFNARGFQFLKYCIQVIEERFLDEPGLYRVAGQSSKVQRLVTAFFSRSKKAVFERESPATLASAVKKYLRDNKQALLVPYESWVSAVKETKRKSEDRKRRLVQCIKDLPWQHRAILQILLSHLNKVLKHAKQNKMKSENIGVVFGPALLRPPLDGSEGSIMSSLPTCAQVVESLVVHFEEISSPSNSYFASKKKEVPYGFLLADDLLNPDGLEEDNFQQHESEAVEIAKHTPSDTLITTLPPQPVHQIGQAIIGADWFVGDRSHAECEADILKQAHGSFVVRRADNGASFQVVSNDHGVPRILVIKVTDDDMFEYGKVSHPNLASAVDEITTKMKEQSLQDNQAMNQSQSESSSPAKLEKQSSRTSTISGDSPSKIMDQNGATANALQELIGADMDMSRIRGRRSKRPANDRGSRPVSEALDGFGDLDIKGKDDGFVEDPDYLKKRNASVYNGFDTDLPIMEQQQTDKTEEPKFQLVEDALATRSRDASVYNGFDDPNC